MMHYTTIIGNLYSKTFWKNNINLAGGICRVKTTEFKTKTHQDIS